MKYWRGYLIAGILAIIVCHDATGVRRETGKHAQVLNELLQSLESGKPIDLKALIGHTDLKELVGHTPLQVCAGIIIGIGWALLMHFVIL